MKKTTALLVAFALSAQIRGQNPPAQGVDKKRSHYSQAQKVSGPSSPTSTFKGPNPWYDITDPAWGAECDGITDDTTAINAALAAANNAKGGMVYVPMGTKGACLVAGQLIMDNFVDVTLMGGSFGRPNGATPRAWLEFTGTTGPLISCKSCFGVHIKHLYLQYTAAFSGVFIDFGHSALAADASGNYVGYNYIGKTGVGGGAAALISLDQANSNIIEGNQLSDALVGIRGRNAPSGSGADYSNGNTVRGNIFGNAGAAGLTACFIQNMGTGNTVQGNDFEIGSSGIGTLCWSAAMTNSGEFTGNWDGDMTGSATFTKYALPANSKWIFSGNVIGNGSANDTAFSLGNDSSLSIHGNTFSEGGSLFGTFLSVGTGDNVAVAANSYGTISTFLSGTPASGLIVDNAGKTMHFGAVSIPTSLQVGGGTVFTGSQGTGSLLLGNTATPPLMFGCVGAASPGTTIFLGNGRCNLSLEYSYPVSAGTFTNLRCAANSGGKDRSDAVITVRKRRMKQTVTCTLGAGTSCSDTKHSFTSAAGDQIDIQVVTEPATTLKQVTCTLEKQ